MSATRPQPESVRPETREEHQVRLAWDTKAIEEALESVEREGTIPLEEVVVWVESWDTPNERQFPSSL